MSDSQDSISKQDLINKIAENCVVAKTFEIREVFEVFEPILVDLLKEGTAVTLPGVGKFTIEAKDETLRRNPKTGEKVIVLPHNVIKFKINAKLKAAVR